MRDSSSFVRLLFALSIATLALGACSKKSEKSSSPKGRIVVSLGVDWEGVFFSTEGFDALDALRKTIGGDVPYTHYVSAAYMTKPKPDPKAAATIASAVHPGDELAVHIHAWKSLAVAAGVEPKLSPSFMTGTDKLLEFEDDTGFDVDFDVYSVEELRKLLQTSRKLLEETRLTPSKTFRAGGYIATPKVLQALREEGYTVDSSAIDSKMVDGGETGYQPKRVREIWPNINGNAQPFLVDAHGGTLIEMPVAAPVDDVQAGDLVKLFEDAHARLQKDPAHDVFITLEIDQETASEDAPRVGDAIQQVRARKDLGDTMIFTTVEKAAELARPLLAPAK